jgi:hypothetical protein
MTKKTRASFGKVFTIVLFTDTIQAKRGIFTFENSTKSYIKMVYLNGLQFLIQNLL